MSVFLEMIIKNMNLFNRNVEKHMIFNVLFTIRTHSVLFVTIVKTPTPILAATSGFLAKLYNSNLKPSKESL